MERWVLYLHLASVLGFMLAHGVQVQVMWRQRGEPDPERNLGLFDPLPGLLLLRLLLGAVIGTGLVAGILVPWWRQWWMWIALALLLAITWLMRRYGGGYYELIQRTATEAIEAAKEGAEASDQAAKRAAFDAARGGWHPIVVSAIGLGGLAIILWLMMFKPF